MRVRYAKRGRMRFASHRDVARAVERGVRRAGLPMAYSAGFTPHPKISYAGAAATGVASEAEYLELALTRPCVPEDVRDRLGAALPDGIEVIDVTVRGREQLADLEVSQWELTLPGVSRPAAQAAVDEFLAASQVEVERLTSRGTRRMDARAAVISMELDQRAIGGPASGCEILRMVVRHTTPAVRPDDILAALGRMAGQRSAGLTDPCDAAGGSSAVGLGLSAPPLVTRLAQGPLDTAGLPAETREHPGASGGSAPRASTAAETREHPGGSGGSAPRASTAAETADDERWQPEASRQEQATRPGATTVTTAVLPQ
ncbi:MAG TPA: TIGR03936 family radical SAM-associated protein [Streptosporangiaceae bacterium]|nr:TIGR03936 family radical SAM-associated protein [Streptosporangiaceae bacterium]